jgi:glycine/D-amino acid oxidase-like deaminating enzyme
MSDTSWKDARTKQRFPLLKEDISTDILIIGGGMAGVLTAYRLAKAGISVAVIEKDTVGGGATMLTTAFLTEDIDTDLADLKSMFGGKRARLIWESHQAAIDLLEEIAKEESIDCDFKRVPAYIFANDGPEFKSLEKDFRTSQELGLTTILQGKTGNGTLPFENAGYLKMPNQGKFHPLKFLNGVAISAEAAGAKIYERTEATKISYTKTGAVVQTPKGKIKAKDVLLATYYPLGNPWATFLKKGMYVSYVLEVEVPSNIFEEALYLDMGNPYHYFRVDKGENKDRLIVGGEDHRKEIKMNPRKNYQALRKYLTKIMGGKPYRINKYWTGPILEPSDGLALIGRTKEHELVATAFSGNGMTYSMIAAELITDIILKKRNPWQKLYDPRRIPTAKQLASKALDYGEELVKGAIKNSIRRK